MQATLTLTLLTGPLEPIGNDIASSANNAIPTKVYYCSRFQPFTADTYTCITHSYE